MDKFLITFASENKKTGDMLVTTSPRVTCPASCRFKDADCYAERGHLGGWLWGILDKNAPGTPGRIKVYTFTQLLNTIKLLIPGSIWRHNQAGDLAVLDDGVTIDSAKVKAIVDANVGKRCFTFTHHDVLTNDANRETIKEACNSGFMVNLSADTLEEADALANLDIAPVAVVLPANQHENTVTPEGRVVAICPAVRKEGVTCSTCQICAKPQKAIIAFPQI